MSEDASFALRGKGLHVFPGRAALPIVADVHMHTSYSHGQAGVDEMYLAARAKGLAIIGFSEHSPRPAGYVYACDYQEKLVAGFPNYVKDVRNIARKAEEDGARVLFGLELDYIPAETNFARALVNEYDFDYIIGGLHFQGTWGFDATAGEWEPLSQAQRFAAYDAYYTDLESMCLTGLFHVAAHPDLIKIFTVDDFNAWLLAENSKVLVKRALTAMKDAGMAMEVSSAGLRKPCKEIYPGPEIMKIASDLALPISFGADAHCVNTPAHAFGQLSRYAASHGYTHSLIFIKGKAQIIPFAS